MGLSEQPALPGPGRAALGIVASSPPGLVPCWDELWRCTGAAEPCCPRTLLLGAAAWEGAGTGTACSSSTKPVRDSRAAEPPLKGRSAGLCPDGQ